VARSVCSVFNELEGVPSYEVVVVDDASEDGTIEHLRNQFREEVEAGRLRLIQNAVNQGVTGSKNAGYLASRFDWVIFLDSDDTLLEDVGNAMISVLDIYKNRPIVFFRCVDQDGNFVGERFGSDVILDLDAYLEHTSYGEALTAINKRMVRQAPYVESLRGYEGLGCCRIIDRYGPAVLSSLVARRYDCTPRDRLSRSKGLHHRMLFIAKGHLMLMWEFGSKMRLRKLIGYLFKAAVYGLTGGAYRIVDGIRKW